MLMNRIIGAFTFRREVFAEVESDTSFTQTAWLLVAVVAFLNALGARAGAIRESFFGWLVGALIVAVFAVIGFAVAAWVMAFVGKSVFHADVTFDEVVRTVGLAYVWNLVGLLGIIGGFSVALACVIAPLQFVGFILGLAASLLALKEALDLEWVQVLITVVIGWIVIFVINMIAAFIVGLFGLGVAGVSGLFSKASL
jgi:hypothetical protein